MAEQGDQIGTLAHTEASLGLPQQGPNLNLYLTKQFGAARLDKRSSSFHVVSVWVCGYPAMFCSDGDQDALRFVGVNDGIKQSAHEWAWFVDG